MPPPTVNGTNTPSLACLTTCTKVEGGQAVPNISLEAKVFVTGLFHDMQQAL